jgi:AraC-like DNA-binding protein
MFYLPVSLVCHAAEEAGIRGVGLPSLPEDPVTDADLLGLLRRVHQRSLAGDALLLEKQEGLLSFLVRLFRRYGKKREIPRSARGSLKIVRVAEYLRSCCEETPSTEDLAALADLSPYHMIRSFSQTFGMPPHAYLLQVRVGRARTMLEEGASPAEAAQATGFADQSHLHRYFRRILGISPGAYRRAFRK